MALITMLFYFLLSILPGILWMFYIYKSDKFEPEPVGIVVKTFIGGMFIVLAAMPIELGVNIMVGYGGIPSNFLDVVWQAYFVAGVIEEVLKFFVVLFYVYFMKEFDEPVDGIVYSSAAALGFASLENFLYMLKYGAQVIVARGILSTLGHLVFSSFWGYALGRGKLHPKVAGKLAIRGLALSAITHGTFNFLLMSKVFAGEYLGMILAALVIPFTSNLWKLVVKRIQKAEAISPYNPKREKDELDDFDTLAKG